MVASTTHSLVRGCLFWIVWQTIVENYQFSGCGVPFPFRHVGFVFYFPSSLPLSFVTKRHTMLLWKRARHNLYTRDKIANADRER